MTRLEELVRAADTVAILGHTNPDGDCVGSCLAAYNYIKEQDPGKNVTVYLEKAPQKLSYMKGFGEIRHEAPEGLKADLCVCLDCSAKDMLKAFGPVLDGAVYSICLDHHVTNPGYAMENIIDAKASSACEVLYGQLDESKISRDVAECLYTGIITDSGVFKYDNTSPKTMEIAGRLMAKGIEFGRIIDEAFYRKSYLQTQILGRALLESVSFLDGKAAFSVVRKKDMEFYGVEKSDLDGIVEQLRLIDGVEVAVFLSESGPSEYKVSLRAKNYADVSRIAKYFGGGGHKKAAGCTMSGSVHDVINNLSEHIERQIREHEEKTVEERRQC